jgi:amino acid adenylation domain-containing protein
MLPDQLLEWNRTEVDYQRDSTIADLFKQQVARTPDAPAVVSNDRQLAYAELDSRSSRLGRYLQDLGVGPETRVGVAMARSEMLVISLLAILKAGGAYVPLDLTYPKDRLHFIIEDSGLSLLLTTSSSYHQFPLQSGGIAGVSVDEFLESTRAASCAEPSSAIKSDATSRSLAYLIYTSGSTGKPKGVMVENRNVVNFFTGMDRAIGTEPGVWLAVTSVSFDISVLELLWTLTRGFKVVVHGDDGTATIAEEITDNAVTHLQMTPSLARMLTLDANAFGALGCLRQILLGGETVPVSLVNHLRQVFNGDIYNMYGPTETTIWSTTHRLQELGSAVSIGRPIANTQIYLLDGELNAVPQGEVGELFIGGDGVARGYWNRPDLTAERFLNIPPLSAQRLYRTGDLARILPDGDMEFLGRGDFQVKLRGRRIELGEIEAALEQCPGIRQAVVVVKEDKADDKRLLAYLVATDSRPAQISALRDALESRLPDYMIPSAYVFLSALPLTDNGKIDRKVLSNLPSPMSATVSASNPSKNSLELIIAGAWQDALGIPSIAIDDNFFELGAHSLTIAEVQARLRQALGRDISLVDLFQFSTVNALAHHLANSASAATDTKASERAQRRRLARQR